jgi:hypothetical protein
VLTFLSVVVVVNIHEDLLSRPKVQDGLIVAGFLLVVLWCLWSILSSLAFHLGHETFSNPRIDRETKVVWRVQGGFTVASLLGWGDIRLCR